MSTALPELNNQTPSKPERKTNVLLALFILLALALVIGYLYVYSHRDKTSQPVNKSQTTQTGKYNIQLALVATGLPYPTDIVSTNQASDSRLFVVQREGLIKTVDQSGKVAAEPFLDIKNLVLSEGEMGLLGLAFSPNYAKDGNFFINYIDQARNTVIARYHVSADAGRADPASARILLTLKQPYDNHNGGDLAFGPDGYLYIALGDGGSAGDPEDRAQNLNSLLGKILRLDVSQAPYKIPAGNPFINQAGKLPEIWGYGLRNPWRISFDRQTHELYIGDVGQVTMEEINVEASGSGGHNYGWRCFEGSRDYNLQGCQARHQYIFPIVEYDHGEERCSITGGFVYRGQKYPTLGGKYFYGDFCGGQLYSAQKKGDQWQQTIVAKTPYQISTFGEDSRGELYLADFNTGSIYRLQAIAQ